MKHKRTLLIISKASLGLMCSWKYNWAGSTVQIPENQEKMEVVGVYGLQGKSAQCSAESRSSNTSSDTAMERKNGFFVFTVEGSTATEIKYWQWKFIREILPAIRTVKHWRGYGGSIISGLWDEVRDSRSNFISANTVCNQGPSWTPSPGPLGLSTASQEFSLFLITEIHNLLKKTILGERKLNRDVIMSSAILKIAIKMREINFKHKRNGIKMPEGQVFKKIIKYFSADLLHE